MNRTTIIRYIFAAVAVAVTNAWADEETVGGYTWTYWINGNTAEIFKNGNCAISPWPTGAVSIPAMFGGKLGMMIIGYRAFAGCKSLTSVTIPDSVTSIGRSAFSGCSGLTNVTIPDSVTSIGGCAFYGCSGLTNVIICSSATKIGFNAFYGCGGLTNVTLPGSMTKVDMDALSDAFPKISVLRGANAGAR